ncbi:putative cyclic nucleotide-binding domain, potassium channel, voltage-dependent, EAG/ELK/ERG [Dioscorea sansibarensis]
MVTTKKANGSHESDEIEYEVPEVKEMMDQSQKRRPWLILCRYESNEVMEIKAEKLFHRLLIHPDNRWYQIWTQFILVWAVYSSFFTPLEFGFFRGLPKNLVFLDVAGQIAFLFDIVVRFLLAYRDSHTYRIVSNPSSIALRYVKSGFVLDLLSCFPWDAIYKACGEKEEVRYLLWIRLVRARKVTDFLEKLEKDIRINYLFIRIVKLIVVELYCTHTAACIFYYLATTLPQSMERYTWIGTLKLGDHTYVHFREIDLYTRYVTSLYFAIVTMATVGYGDIHAVNPREMVFVMIFLSFDMILGAYLIGNMTALIVKGSKTERFRDKMKDLIKYMNRNKLDKEIREQIKAHARLQYERSYTEASVLQDIPASIRAKISQRLYKPFIENIPLFNGCSPEFYHQIVINLHEEFFLPGQDVMEPDSFVYQLYFVLHGVLEAVNIGELGTETPIQKFEQNSSFGEIAILCNTKQPYAVRARDLCQLLRLDKQVFTNILQTYFVDGRKILTNLLKENKNNIQIKQLESDIIFNIEKQEAEIALRVNSAAFHGDLNHLKVLIKAGADPKKTDYDGRSPLHLAASRGNEDVTSFLIQEGVDVNLTDKFGCTPLSEAIKNGHDGVASLLFREGARLSLSDAGSHLCMAVAKGDADFLRRVLSYGIDPNSKDYDHRTPLHVAVAEGLYFIAKILLEAGASVLSQDRWGNTPLDEAHECGNRSLIKLLEDAKSKELQQHTPQPQVLIHQRRCIVYPFHPRDSSETKMEGVMIWVPNSIEDLIKSSKEQLKCSGSCILSEDGAKILDAEMIADGQKLYLASDQDIITMHC